MTRPRSFAEAVELRARRDPDGELIRRVGGPAVSAGARRLALAITRDFFVADREAHFATLEAFATPELQGDEWPAERIV